MNTNKVYINSSYDIENQYEHDQLLTTNTDYNNRYISSNYNQYPQAVSLPPQSTNSNYNQYPAAATAPPPPPLPLLQVNSNFNKSFSPPPSYNTIIPNRLCQDITNDDIVSGAFCRDCGNQFVRYEKYRNTDMYFKCEDCMDIQNKHQQSLINKKSKKCSCVKYCTIS